ncbi:hypothetical protein V2J09_009199 [Rumex salicifolius]
MQPAQFNPGSKRMSLFSPSVYHPQHIPYLCLMKPTPITTFWVPFYTFNHTSRVQFWCCSTRPTNSNAAIPEDEPDEKKKSTRARPRKKPVDDLKVFPSTIPKKPRRGRRSEKAAVEDFVRDSLERTFASIREQNPEFCLEKERILKERLDKDDSSDDDGEVDQEMMVEEESPDWPLDADVGWGIRASDYFENHAIKNVVAEDGTIIDWEGEIDDNWVQEINCLEWERFAFHPSPLIVLVFERYNRASDNWKALKELEKALKVYWNAKDRLPPRAVKLDLNIERDLACALKVREGPQILFVQGHRILYREKEHRSANDLVQMIAFFYYNAKKPSWIDQAALTF